MSGSSGQGDTRRIKQISNSGQLGSGKLGRTDGYEVKVQSGKGMGRIGFVGGQELVERTVVVGRKIGAIPREKERRRGSE
jgi:hypothetical protein